MHSPVKAKYTSTAEMIHKRTVSWQKFILINGRLKNLATSLRSQFNNMTAKSHKVVSYCITLKSVADDIDRLKKFTDKYL
ncbi:hypothetical protein T01_444 [Trichinella spiralis]|uniref:Uncharacterized protein n=1 Tax=Trichinella spiralis TaxID=6334 RepID=A0A0V1BNS7_TRISP|nr:hypothetical protein T01_444 [Trichinella spiralis]